MTGKEIHVIKASGESEPFSALKLRKSLKRARIPRDLQNELLADLQENLYDNIPTVQIYNQVLKSLQDLDYSQGKARYSLKQAIMMFGPSGYPFEKFMAEVFTSRGYKTDLDIIFKGKCTKHEIDVVAHKRGEYLLTECKFHNRTGIRSDIKHCLYVKARFDDIMANWQGKLSRVKFVRPCLVTNTKFSVRSIRYGECAGIKLIGWNYPEKNSLRDWVEKANLHPITCLTSLSQAQKARLLEEGIVLCRDLSKAEPRLLKGFGIPSHLIAEAIGEAKLVSSL
ncbi:MAG TPA: ATP cone domain-containing protein [Candidatus Bathyarchaeia archaeon]|nr:ATP cone domain-containing protein [Candidatus Bathyarchaeia archaeon]